LLAIHNVSLWTARGSSLRDASAMQSGSLSQNPQKEA
jgi:hypothetical protein